LLPVLIFCFAQLSLGVDNPIIHKDGEPSLLDFLSKYCVHHHLKCHW
jgi:hypothetical protein